MSESFLYTVFHDTTRQLYVVISKMYEYGDNYFVSYMRKLFSALGVTNVSHLTKEKVRILYKYVYSVGSKYTGNLSDTSVVTNSTV